MAVLPKYYTNASKWFVIEITELEKSLLSTMLMSYYACQP